MQKNTNNSSVLIGMDYYYFRATIGMNYHPIPSAHSALCGYPISGHIMAKSKEEAISKAILVANHVKDNLFYGANENAFDLMGGNKVSGLQDVKCSQSLSVISVEVHLAEIYSDTADCHDEKLKNCINLIWANVEGRERLKIILEAYYKRDCDELANFYSDECVWWKANELSYREMWNEVSFSELAYEMFNHILDDDDLRAIINYIRPFWVKGWEDCI